jgi:hypothetical protein
MRSRDRVSAQLGRFTIFMIGLVVTVNLLLIFPVLTQAQSDPLSPFNMPTIDTNPADYPSNIWITDTMQKVRQDSGSPGTQHWGTFYGTQNEFVDFQVHVQAPSGGIANLNVTVSNFVQTSPHSYTISNTSPQVVVYREAYMNVTGYVSSTASTYYGVQGYYPDILIPTVDPYWGQTTNAWPYTVVASKNQSAWIDVLIPQAALPGYYLGSVTVKSGSTTLATMPVIIAVWQWPSSGYMPSTTTLKADNEGFGYNGLCQQMYSPGSTVATTGCGAYPDAGGGNDGGVTQTWIDAGIVLKDHRYGDGGQTNKYPSQTGNFTTWNAQGGMLMNGGCRHGGAYCPILSGSKNTTLEMGELGSQPWSSSVVSLWKSYVGGLSSNPTFTIKLCDEPPAGCSWSTLNSTATAYAGYSGFNTPRMVTTDLVSATANSAQNNIDILAVELAVYESSPGVVQSGYAAWLSGSTNGIPRQRWSYIDCMQAGTCSNGTVGGTGATQPNYMVDGKPAAHRAMEWVSYLQGATGELYYAADVCGNAGYPGTACGYPLGSTHDPWVSVYYSGGWGDGNLIYTGQGSVSGANNYLGLGVTTPIILPSVRLKHMRDGMQDYEYLNVLKNNGQSSLVSTQIANWITNSYTFETSGTGLRAARTALGTAMHQLSYPARILPPPSVNGALKLTK